MLRYGRLSLKQSIFYACRSPHVQLFFLSVSRLWNYFRRNLNLPPPKQKQQKHPPEHVNLISLLFHYGSPLRATHSVQFLAAAQSTTKLFQFLMFVYVVCWCSIAVKCFQCTRSAPTMTHYIYHHQNSFLVFRSICFPVC